MNSYTHGGPPTHFKPADNRLRRRRLYPGWRIPGGDGGERGEGRGGEFRQRDIGD